MHMQFLTLKSLGLSACFYLLIFTRLDFLQVPSGIAIIQYKDQITLIKKSQRKLQTDLFYLQSAAYI